ncbi:MAG: AraC family transcriptional regulator [Pseudomonadota bacterium]
MAADMEDTDPRHPEILGITKLTGANAWKAALPHSEPFHQLIWITRGQGLCVLDGRRRGLVANTALLIPAGFLHLINIQPPCFGFVCRVPVSEAVEMPDGPELVRVVDQKRQIGLSHLLEAMQQEEQNQEHGYMQALSAQANLLLVLMRRALQARDDAPRKPSAAQRKVTQFAALVEQNFKSGDPMHRYAREIGVTPTHLSRICKACTGITSADILTGRVLHAARNRLENSRLPSKQIASELGFNSAAYFSRFIQKHTGMTPTRLRKGI